MPPVASICTYDNIEQYEHVKIEYDINHLLSIIDHYIDYWLPTRCLDSEFVISGLENPM